MRIEFHWLDPDSSDNDLINGPKFYRSHLNDEDWEVREEVPAPDERGTYKGFETHDMMVTFDDACGKDD